MDIKEAIEEFEKMRNGGTPLFEISKHLGISLATLRRWEGDRQCHFKLLKKRSINTLPKVVLVNEISPWGDIVHVVGRLTLGIVASILLFKAAGWIKAVAIVLTGESHF